MSTLAPKMSDQISYERPVGATPSVLESVVGVATDLGADFLNAKARSGSSLSASDKKGMALSNYVARLDEIDSMDISQTEKERLTQSTRRDQLIATPQYRADISAISGEEFGFEEGQGDVGRVINDQYAEWLATPEGANAVLTTLGDGTQGDITSEASRGKLFVRFQEDMAHKARVVALANDKVGDETKWRTLAPQWHETTAGMATGMVHQAATNPEILANPEQAMLILNDSIKSQTAKIRAEATAAGINPAFIEEQIATSIKPLVDLQKLYTQDLETPGLFLDAVTKSAELGVTRLMLDALGPIAADPVAKEIYLTHMINGEINGDNAQRMLEGIKEASRTGDLDSFNFQMDVVPGISEAVTLSPDVVQPVKVDEWRKSAKEDNNFLPDKIAVATTNLNTADVNTDVGVQQVKLGLQHVITAANAHEGPLGEGTLRQIFSAKSIENIKSLGEEGESMLASLMVQQVKYNRALVANNGSLLHDTRVRQENGRFVAEKRVWSGPGLGENWAPVSSSSVLAKSTASVNMLMNITSQVPNINKTVTDATNWLYRGVEPTPERLSSLPDDFQWSDIENIQHVSYQAPNALVPLIDRTEGGGAYDTLFGFSQRDGGRFANTAVDEMTLDQVFSFADPDGAYGQWVKTEVGRVATPMGRYQFVGTTARQVTREMGLPNDTIFNAKTQDAMFDHLARSVLRGKTGSSARNALRGTWEGFKHVSDQELDVAIASFKGTPPVPSGSLDRGDGVNFDNSNPSSSKANANGFIVGSGDGFSGSLRGVDEARAKRSNPFIKDSDSAGVVPTGEDAKRSSRMSANEAKQRVIALLNDAGMSDMVNEVVKGDE